MNAIANLDLVLGEGMGQKPVDSAAAGKFRNDGLSAQALVE